MQILRIRFILFYRVSHINFVDNILTTCTRLLSCFLYQQRALIRTIRSKYFSSLLIIRFPFSTLVMIFPSSTDRDVQKVGLDVLYESRERIIVPMQNCVLPGFSVTQFRKMWKSHVSGIFFWCCVSDESDMFREKHYETMYPYIRSLLSMDNICLLKREAGSPSHKKRGVPKSLKKYYGKLYFATKNGKWQESPAKLD